MINQWAEYTCEWKKLWVKWMEKYRQRKGSIYVCLSSTISQYIFFVVVAFSDKLMFLVIIICSSRSTRIIIAFSFILCYDGKTSTSIIIIIITLIFSGWYNCIWLCYFFLIFVAFPLFLSRLLSSLAFVTLQNQVVLSSARMLWRRWCSRRLPFTLMILNLTLSTLKKIRENIFSSLTSFPIWLIFWQRRTHLKSHKAPTHVHEMAVKIWTQAISLAITVCFDTTFFVIIP